MIVLNLTFPICIRFWNILPSVSIFIFQSFTTLILRNLLENFNPGYIDLLIETEKSEADPGWLERVAHLTKQRELAVQSLKYYENELAGKEFIAANKFSYADIQAVTSLQFLVRLNKIDVNEYNNLSEYNLSKHNPIVVIIICVKM